LLVLLELGKINSKFKMIPHIFFWILALMAVEGRVVLQEKRSRGRADDPMPIFEDVTCEHELLANLCIKVTFPDKIEDVLVLTRMGADATLYEGFLQEDNDVTVVLITSQDNTRLIQFNSDHAGFCYNFNVDLEKGTVKCIRGGFNSENDDNRALMNAVDRSIDDANTNGATIPLGSHFDASGIPIKVLFTFDTSFYNEFNRKDGKSGENYMDEVMALVKNAFSDKTLKGYLGTKINIMGTKTKHSSSFPQNADLGTILNNAEILKLAENGGNYDLFTFITHPGASGVAKGGMVCADDNRYRISFNKAYGSTECNTYDPPERMACTTTERIALTAETIAHELGHVLGMAHDFKQAEYNAGNGYVYRKFDSWGNDCRGLMDYIDDGVGWSKCSARDFSRYLTNGGQSKPCLKRNGRPEEGECYNKNKNTYCDKGDESNISGCTDSRYSSWFPADCEKLCGVGSCVTSTCTNKNEYGFCKNGNEGYCASLAWFKKDCAKLCGAC